MFRLSAEHFKVFWSIVSPVPVDMVNNLSRSQKPANLLLGNYPVHVTAV
jgi:hypothetical protein